MKKIFVACIVTLMCFVPVLDDNICEGADASSLNIEETETRSSSEAFELLRKVFDAQNKQELLVSNEYIEQAIAKYPDVPYFYFLRADLCSYPKLNKRDEKIPNFDKAIELDPKFSRAYEARAYYYQIKKEYDKALADYEKVIELEPDNAFPHRMLAHMYKKQGEHDKALEENKKVVEIAPDFSSQESLICAESYFSKSCYDDAIMYCSNIINASKKLKESKDKTKRRDVGGRIMRIEGIVFVPLPGRGDVIFRATEEITNKNCLAAAYVLRGKAYHAQGKHQEAIKDGKAALAEISNANGAKELIEKAEAALKNK